VHGPEAVGARSERDDAPASFGGSVEGALDRGGVEGRAVSGGPVVADVVQRGAEDTATGAGVAGGPAPYAPGVAGWGDDPVLEELRQLIADGWVPVAVHEDRSSDTVIVERAGERRELSSDHIAFHRFVEGLREEHRL
jgi:hypothetical protein